MGSPNTCTALQLFESNPSFSTSIPTKLHIVHLLLLLYITLLLLIFLLILFIFITTIYYWLYHFLKVTMTYPCGNCSHNIQQEDSVCCDGCSIWFHLKCSQLTPSKFKTLINKPTLNWYCSTCLTCKHCNKLIKGESTHCDICKHWFHVKCTYNTTRFDILRDSVQDWHCRSCVKDIFPFYNTSNNKLQNMFGTTQAMNQVID